MINFFSKKSSPIEQKAIPLKNKFPWLNNIDNQFDELIDQDINIRINEILSLHNFFQSSKGRKKLEYLKEDLIEVGYPKVAVDLELELMIKIFDKATLNNLLFNPTGGLNIHKDGNKFKSDKLIYDNFGILRSAKGKILIVGSSNTLLPIMTAMLISYILGNITVVQLSSLHINSIPKLIHSLPSEASKFIHFTKLDHNNEEDRKYIKSLLVSVNWNVVNLWGGNESLNFFYSQLLKNPFRPRIVSMEPLTGMTIIQNRYIYENKKKIAKELAHSIFLMGQQLCSSPTIGFVITDDLNIFIEDFANQVILEIENLYIENNTNEANSIKLDRMLNSATDNGSRVYRSKKYNNNICVIESTRTSIFADKKSNNFLNIHERRNFIELVKVENFYEAIEQIRALPNQYAYKETQKIQTILPFGDKKFIKKVFNLAKKIGAYRIIDSEFTLLRHAMEPLDGYNLINEFTNQIAISGKHSNKIENL